MAGQEVRESLGTLVQTMTGFRSGFRVVLWILAALANLGFVWAYQSTGRLVYLVIAYSFVIVLAAVYRSGAATPVAFTLVATDRGDVVELRDASGASFAAYRYDSWGLPLGTVTAGTAAIDAATAARIASVQPIRYAGYCYDEHAGLYYLSARTYDPATRQFLTKDPAKDDGEESAYQYCGGDPVGGVDPSGLKKMISGMPWPGQTGFTQSGETCFWYAMKAMLFQRGKGKVSVDSLRGRFSNHLIWWNRWNNQRKLFADYHLKSVWGGVPSFLTIKQEINHNRPIIGIGWSRTSRGTKGHAWVVWGYTDSKSVLVWTWGNSKWLNLKKLRSTEGVLFDKAYTNRLSWSGGRSWYGFK